LDKANVQETVTQNKYVEHADKCVIMVNVLNEKIQQQKDIILARRKDDKKWDF